jgi:hypothetical protein
MSRLRTVHWNDQLRLVFSDVDETIADLYRPAERRMVAALSNLLEQNVSLVLITGQSVENVEERVVMALPARLRRQVAIGACSGAELWGYSPAGNRRESPHYTAENVLTAENANAWRAIVQQLIEEFRLSAFATMPIADFRRKAGDEPLCVMLDDRGPQITLELPNAYRLSAAARRDIHLPPGLGLEGDDLRAPILRRAQQLLDACPIPVTARMAGMFALDLAITGIDKSRAVTEAISPGVLGSLGLDGTVPTFDEIEIWGDRFSQQAGTDWLMCKPIDRRVRAISFRDENSNEFPEGYNIQLWDGAQRLHAGLLEFIEGRS